MDLYWNYIGCFKNALSITQCHCLNSAVLLTICARGKCFLCPGTVFLVCESCSCVAMSNREQNSMVLGQAVEQ